MEGHRKYNYTKRIFEFVLISSNMTIDASNFAIICRQLNRREVHQSAMVNAFNIYWLRQTKRAPLLRLIQWEAILTKVVGKEVLSHSACLESISGKFISKKIHLLTLVFPVQVSIRSREMLLNQVALVTRWGQKLQRTPRFRISQEAFLALVHTP